MKNHRGASNPIVGSTSRLIVGVLVMLALVGMGRPALCQPGEKQVVHLYFGDASKPFLVGESRVMVDPGQPALFGRQLVQALIDGPSGDNLATIPAGTRLRSFFLLGDGTAVVDFSPELRENHPGGCRKEQLTLFSVVNTLVLNLPAVDRVQIMIDGTQEETLTGHVALAYPLTADLLLTR